MAAIEQSDPKAMVLEIHAAFERRDTAAMAACYRPPIALVSRGVPRILHATAEVEAVLLWGRAGLDAVGATRSTREIVSILKPSDTLCLITASDTLWDATGRPIDNNIVSYTLRRVDGLWWVASLNIDQHAAFKAKATPPA